MRTYQLDSTLHFGKYEGETLRSILEKDPDYVVWCFQNLGHFHIAREVLEAFPAIAPGYAVPGWVQEAWTIKEEAADRYHAHFRQERSLRSRVERESYGEYQGHYAQYEEGLSDDFINNVLEGDPDAYWNID